MSTTSILESIFVSNHRLTRIAAQSTGSTTTAAVWSTLSVLMNDGPKRIGDLARDARISQPGMTKLLQNLVADEWVYRIADVEDSRAWLIAIAPKGTAAITGWRAEVAEAMEPIFRDLSARDWATLKSAASILESRVAAAAVAA
jgi:DNA-binding MarR family transcriptional regulator